MKKTLLLILISVLAIFCLVACDNDGVPNGMKVAYDASRADYTLFVPEGWIIDTMDEMSAAHVSDGDRTSISVKKSKADNVNSWWTSYKKALSSTFRDLNITIEGEDYVLSGLNGQRFVFTASFNNASHYKYELFGVEKGDYVYEIMIKYQGSKNNDTISYTDEKHKDSIKKILDNFKINDALEGDKNVSYEAENTPADMKCASNTKIVDYYLFVPNTWQIDKTSGTVSSAYVSEKDKTNVSVMQWNVQSYDFTEWLNEYKLQLYSTFDYSAIPLNDKGEVVTGENNTVNYLPSDIISMGEGLLDFYTLGEEKYTAKQLNYSLKIDGTVYDFQVIATMHRASVYIMTFTFKNGCDMSLYQEDINKITNNFRFS